MPEEQKQESPREGTPQPPALGSQPPATVSAEQQEEEEETAEEQTLEQQVVSDFSRTAEEPPFKYGYRLLENGPRHLKSLIRVADQHKITGDLKARLTGLFQTLLKFVRELNAHQKATPGKPGNAGSQKICERAAAVGAQEYAWLADAMQHLGDAKAKTDETDDASAQDTQIDAQEVDAGPQPMSRRAARREFRRQSLSPGTAEFRKVEDRFNRITTRRTMILKEQNLESRVGAGGPWPSAEQMLRNRRNPDQQLNPAIVKAIQKKIDKAREEYDQLGSELPKLAQILGTETGVDAFSGDPLGGRRRKERRRRRRSRRKNQRTTHRGSGKIMKNRITMLRKTRTLKKRKHGKYRRK